MLWDKIATADTVSHIACYRMINGNSTRMHSHDFVELFWGIEGHANHEINGTTSVIGEKELFFIRSEDIHNIYIAGNGNYCLNNLAFHRDIINELSQRYESTILDRWNSREEKTVIKYQLTQPLFQWLNAKVRDVFSYRHSRLTLDFFLINLIYELEKQEKSPFPENCPEWLNKVYREAFKPEVFRQGPMIFSKLSGYTQEHVARELKKYTAKTPTEILNEARLQHSAMLLITSSDSISDISYDCGYQSLSYFFSAFKRRFGTTPRHYRNRNKIFR